MARYIAHRLVLSIPILIGITLFVFMFIALAPGDPLASWINPEVASDLEVLAALRAEFGLDKPLPIRYVNWLRQVLQGNLGYRTKTFDPVAWSISTRIGPTLLLMGAGLLIGVAFGIPLGIFSALRQYSWIDFTLTGFVFLGISTPVFFAGIAALFLFALRWRIFPVGGMSTIGTQSSATDILYHLILPASIIGIQYVAILLRYTRSSLLEVVHEEYITTARAKGLHERFVILRHALRNALIPVVTVIGLNIPQLVAGAVFTETIFAWPGMGTLYVDGVMSRDFPLIMGLTLVSATIILLSNLITDITYAFVDPRIRYQ
jgi:peptide/nickel transport system permease protein